MITPINNNVIINTGLSYSDMINGVFKTKSGLEIPIKHYPVNYIMRSGTVMAVPDKIKGYKISNEPLKYNSEWETQLEVKSGDTVYFRYFEAVQALGRLVDPIKMDNHKNEYINEIWFAVDEDGKFWYPWNNEYGNNEWKSKPNKIWFPLHYNALIMKVDDNQITMLNGRMLVEPLYEDEVKTNLILPDSLKKKANMQMGIIRHIGKANGEYFYQNNKFDYDGIEVGQKIMFDKFNAIKIEEGSNQTLDKTYYYMQRRHVYYIF